MKTLGVGLYGMNGHQVHGLLRNHPRARLVAAAGMDSADHPSPFEPSADLRSYPTLAELLNDDDIELVVLCSPRRRDQAEDAIRALDAGKHVYAEKPCAMTETDLDAILATAERTGRQFHEMVNTALEQPYVAMRRIVESGALGRIVQVFAQKSYRNAFQRRPQDENIDGGLVMQVGVHAFRMIEHVGRQRIADVAAVTTRLGNPVNNGGLRMAASLAVRLAGGGIGSVVLNYLNPDAFPTWGNEQLCIFGTRGFVESRDAGAHTRLVVQQTDHGPLDVSEPARDFFDHYVDHLLGMGPMPFTLDEEIHPTRMIIRAHHVAQHHDA